MFQYIRSVRRVEYVARISSVTTFYIHHWKVFKNIRHADRQTDLQLDAFYDRGSTFSLYIFSEWRGFSNQNRRNINPVSKNDATVYLGHGINHRDAI